MNFLVDTHAHLLKEYYELNKEKDSIKKIVNHALEQNVKRIINISTTEKNLKDVIESTKNYNEVFGAIGIHPQNALEIKKPIEDLLVPYLNMIKIVAIGEIGFDFYRNSFDELKEAQNILFHKQMKIAKKMDLPVIIHSRSATKTTLKELKKYPEIKKVIHCFSENVKVMENYLSIPNTFISFTGLVTFKNAKDIQDAFLKCPINKLMFETDCPFLAPTPFRGKINKPGYVKNICEYCAKLKNMSFIKLQEITTQNAYYFFNKLY